LVVVPVVVVVVVAKRHGNGTESTCDNGYSGHNLKSDIVATSVTLSTVADMVRGLS
jgi:hypothetical protein